MRRAGNPTGLMDDADPVKAPDRIENTSLTSDLALHVNETFKLTDGSTRTPTWSISGISIPGFSIDPATGVINCTIAEADANKNYRVMVTASDGAGIIDAREFNFYPKSADKDGIVKFVIPLDGDTHVTCNFGPRRPPAAGATSNHKGMDFARKDHSLGNILAAGDGTVVRCGPGTGWGNVIFIEHNDAQGRLVATTVYGHWSEAYVAVGQHVAAGQKIAKEGNVGIGTGAHLHFEMHKGKFGNPVDPAPYLNGSTELATSGGSGGGSGPSTPVTRTNVGMTSNEAINSNADCPQTLPADTNLPPKTPSDEQTPDLPANNKNKYRAACAIGDPPPVQTVKDVILAECSAEGLTPEEANFILTVATIESGLDPAAKNPTSSATGLYQMLDAIAVKYFGLLNLSPTCENRIDPAKSTRAMIKFFQLEFKPYYQNYVSSGKTKIANKTIAQTSWSVQYPNFTMGEFMYGLIHHDGVGNAVSGTDKGGVSYWRSKVKSA
jgi:murein DD-endopeptidase MepM/ murein hydrolase activator NlpD